MVLIYYGYIFLLEAGGFKHAEALERLVLHAFYPFMRFVEAMLLMPGRGLGREKASHPLVSGKSGSKSCKRIKQSKQKDKSYK